MARHIGTDGARLFAPGVIQVALCCAVIDIEPVRIAKTRRQRMTQEQDIAANPVDRLAKRFGLRGARCKESWPHHETGHEDGHLGSHADGATPGEDGWPAGPGEKL